MSRREARLEDSGSLGTSPIASNSITTAKILDGSVTTAKLTAINKVTSANTAGSTAAAAWADFGPTVSITTSGYPVRFRVMPSLGAGTTESMFYFFRSGAGGIQFQVYRNSTLINAFAFIEFDVSISSVNVYFWNDLSTEDNPGAGTHVYKLQAQLYLTGGSASAGISNYRLVVEEIRN